jgi:CheY-like chemotaxis protein/two-component sensor histidine kinase
MTRLIDDLLDVTRISQGKMLLKREVVELATIVQGAVETSRPLIQQYQHELSLALPEQPLYLDADVTRLAQVFSNLLNNAAKYTPPGGHIELSAQRQGSDVLISVKDSGIGIPADKLPTIFEMFSQVHPALERTESGLGIGLSLVKRLVEMHGGIIEARSRGPGQGAEFEVRLALVLAAQRPTTTPGSDEWQTAPSAMRILIVDDNRDAADTLGRLLRIVGHDVRTAYDGEQGVQAANEFRPHAMLLDIGMPKLNGYDACRHIRQEPWGKNIVLVAVTGWGQDQDKQKAEEAGFDRHMVKPVEPKRLMRLLEELCVRGTAAESPAGGD